MTNWQLLGAIFGGLILEIAIIFVARMLIQKGWLKIGYLIGLPLIFFIWFVIERQLLGQCIACFVSKDLSISQEVCCKTERLDLVLYAQIAVSINIAYLIAMSAIIIIERKRKTILHPNETDRNSITKVNLLRELRPISEMLAFHTLVTAIAGMTILSIVEYINHFDLTSWKKVTDGFYLGVIPTGIAFFILLIFVRPVLKGVLTIQGNGLKGNADIFIGIIVLAFSGLFIAAFCWVVSYAFISLGYFYPI
jgi:hypothetical protein